MAFSDVILMHSKSDQELYSCQMIFYELVMGLRRILTMNVRLTFTTALIVLYTT